MTTTINGVRVGYTENGNAYKKSNTGKKVGKAAYLGLATAGLFTPYETLAKCCPIDIMREKCGLLSRYATSPFVSCKQFVSCKHPELEKAIKTLIEPFKKGKGNKAQKYLAELVSTKGGRVALLGASAAVSLAMGLAVCRFIGGIYDKIVDKGAKAEADRRAALNE